MKNVKSTKNGYKVDFNSNTFTMTKRFSDAAKNTNSAEYRTLSKFLRDFPDMVVITKAAPRRKGADARLSYDKMVKYLSCQIDAERLLLMFSEIRERSKAQANPYLYVKRWFLDMFPHYKDYPQFDENGKTILISAARRNSPDSDTAA